MYFKVERIEQETSVQNLREGFDWLHDSAELHVYLYFGGIDREEKSCIQFSLTLLRAILKRLEELGDTEIHELREKYDALAA